MYFLYKIIKHKFHNFIDSKTYHATLTQKLLLIVFVTDAKILQGLTPQQISSKLAIDPDSTFTIIEFPPRGIEGIASPINRDYSKFIGDGKTSGGTQNSLFQTQEFLTIQQLKLSKNENKT